MKKKVALLVVMILLCNMMVVPASAADNFTQTNQEVITTTTSSSSYFSKITTKLNSLTGKKATSTLSSGTCLGSTQSVTSVTVYCRVSSGSDTFTLYVTSPNGTTKTVSCKTSSQTYTLTGFNGEDPDGKWTIGVLTDGTVSTVTCTLKVYYTYSS